MSGPPRVAQLIWLELEATSRTTGPGCLRSSTSSTWPGAGDLGLWPFPGTVPSTAPGEAADPPHAPQLWLGPGTGPCQLGCPPGLPRQCQGRPAGRAGLGRSFQMDRYCARSTAVGAGVRLRLSPPTGLIRTCAIRSVRRALLCLCHPRHLAEPAGDTQTLQGARSLLSVLLPTPWRSLRALGSKPRPRRAQSGVTGLGESRLCREAGHAPRPSGLSQAPTLPAR